MYFQIRRYNANADAFFWFLVDLHRELNNQMIVIWDRLGGHRKAANAMKDLAVPWITFEYLPAYSPETQSSGARLVDDQVRKISQLARS